jgi:MFS family permease
VSDAAPIAANEAHTPESRRTFWLLVGNGAIVTMGSAFYSFETVMAGLAFELTGSTLLVGLLVTVATSGWFWPQLIVGSRIQHLPEKMPAYRLSAFLRVSGVSSMIAATWLLSDRGEVLYWAILACTTLFAVGGGICVIPFMDILAKSIPVAHRPMLMAYRQSIGGVLGCAAGLATLYILGDHSGLTFPYNYLTLFVVGGAINSVAYYCVVAIQEPIEAVNPEQQTFGGFIAGGVRVFREDRDFRYYFYYRVCLYLAYMSQSLLVPFAMARFETPLAATGLFAAGIALTGGVFSLLWGRIARRIGEVGLFPMVSLLAFVPFGFMAALAFLPEGNAIAKMLTPHFHWIVLAVFACLTAARQGIDMAGSLYLLAMPPATLRPTYFAFMNSISAPLMLSPILAGWLAGSASFAMAFALSALAALGMVSVSLTLRKR